MPSGKINQLRIFRRFGFSGPASPGRISWQQFHVADRWRRSPCLSASAAACCAIGVPVDRAIAAIETFIGLARRFDIVGTENEISVIDDFGHNPDKIAATLATLKAFPGRVVAFFQPHGFGPIQKMGAELAGVFSEHLNGDDRVILCDPVYFGGTVDRTLGSESIVDAIIAAGGAAEYFATREDCGDRIIEIARAGDRIVIMGARDDTLHSFAQSILAAVANSRAEVS